ncbi:MAG: NAD(P)H-dependent oxidoreductase subunit E [Spirochaetaceae bacterium]|jgi:NADH-quinone oxidoreductase subunit E|nr:NAD(P)H-dependent oxidoreductase subunit E [Spirochaetaceae bacterium]
MAFDYGSIDRIIERWSSTPSATIPILKDIQEQYRHLPPEIFPYLAKKLGVSEARVYGVATFYKTFSLKPKGRFIIKVCDGTACHVLKAGPLLTSLRNKLGLSEIQDTTADFLFTLETVSCLGVCALAPVLSVNERVYPAMTPEKVSALLKELHTEAQTTPICLKTNAYTTDGGSIRLPQVW